MLLGTKDLAELDAIRWQLAGVQVEIKLMRFGLALRASNRDQPRVPAGNPDGGQWTSGDDGDESGGRPRAGSPRP